MFLVRYILIYQPLLLQTALLYLKIFSRRILFVYIDKYEIELCLTSVSYLTNIITYLKYFSCFKFDSISDIVAFDNYKMSQCRYKILYNFLSTTHATRLRISVYTTEKIPVESLAFLFKNANWLEREIWDLMGILFKNHPDLRRILTDYGFIGHPLRKDFPLSGFVEVYYNNNYKFVGLKHLSLAQEFRKFEQFNPWV